MGKKKKIRTQNKGRAKNRKAIRPDDYFSYGPFEMARFGKFVISRSMLSKDSFDAMQEKLVQRFSEVCHEIDNKVSEIAELVKKLPPDELLKRAYWEMALHHIDKASEVDLGPEEAVSVRMLDYIQSVIASVKAFENVQEDITEEQWKSLKKLVEDLFSQLNFEFMTCQTAVNRKVTGENLDFEEFYFKAQMYWSNVRGQRYTIHEIPFFRDVLSPHDDILNELFGVSIEVFLKAIQNIQDSLTLGIGKLFDDLDKFRHVTNAKIEEKIKAEGIIEQDNLQNLMAKIIKENKWESWRDDIFGRLSGLDLFDIKKITGLPCALLDELSWEPGQDTDFFAEGEYKGWPLRVWPVFKRPFLKLNGNYYCFDLHSLFDNLYRVIQRMIIRKKKEYLPVWNNKQQVISEKIPLTLFERLLPDARVYHPVYYRWHTDPSSGKQWCEADALLIYEDHLFVIEVKGGAFTYTPPTSDFPAYIESLSNLVLKPAMQGKRFLEYLESSDEIILFDGNHDESGRISRKDFEHVTICAISLDPFTEMASQVQHLKKISIDVGVHSVWSISIDDLRVYSDIFDNPLVFLHFVEQRMRAFHSNIIQTDDELDHLGLYLKHNLYTENAKKLDSNQRITWFGYRSEIDRYFAEKLHDSKAVCALKQDMPIRLKEIVNFLYRSTKSDRRKVSSMLLNLGGEWRDNIFDGIDDVLHQQSISKRAKPLSTYGGLNITLFYWQKGVIERNERLALQHSKALMLVTKDKDRLLLELTFDAAGKIEDAEFSFLKLEDISVAELEILKTKAEALKAERIDKAKQTFGQIGRNDPCPCGSGKKYKRCCGFS